MPPPTVPSLPPQASKALAAHIPFPGTPLPSSHHPDPDPNPNVDALRSGTEKALEIERKLNILLQNNFPNPEARTRLLRVPLVPLPLPT